MITRAEGVTIETRKIMNGPGGPVLAHYFTREQMSEKARLCAVITLAPGAGVGQHSHNPDAEIYYILEGELAVNDNGVETVMKPGDAMWTANGHFHSAENRTDKDVKMLAVVIL